MKLIRKIVCSNFSSRDGEAYIGSHFKNYQKITNDALNGNILPIHTE